MYKGGGTVEKLLRLKNYISCFVIAYKYAIKKVVKARKKTKEYFKKVLGSEKTKEIFSFVLDEITEYFKDALSEILHGTVDLIFDTSYETKGGRRTIRHERRERRPLRRDLIELDILCPISSSGYFDRMESYFDFINYL